MVLATRVAATETARSAFRCANQTSLVILEADRSFLPMRHERIHPLAQEHDVLAVFDDFAEQAHAPGSCVKSSAMARAWCGWASNQACVSLRDRKSVVQGKSGESS